MLNRVVRWFVCRYIRRNVSHSRFSNRCAILRALNEGMAKEFSEDNLNTRASALVQWMLECDAEAQRLRKGYEGDAYAEILSEAIKEGAQEGLGLYDRHR